MKTRQLQDKKTQMFESEFQLICMGSCCTNHHVTIQDSLVVLLSTTRMHIPLVPCSTRDREGALDTPITLCHRGLTTPIKRACVHSLSLRFMCIGSIHPFILFCPHDSHSHTSSCPCGSHSECVLPRLCDLFVCICCRLLEVLV